jgi:type II secretory pathway pseudopilin PulG
VELLIVISIIIILMAVSIPAVKFAMEDQKVREASRQMNAFFAAAQARAAERGRPVGVYIERLAGASGESYAIQLFMAETPPPYTGDTLNAKATVTKNVMLNRWEVKFPDGNSAMLTTTMMLIKPNDRFVMRFNYQGPYYQCVRDATGNFIITLPRTDVPPPGSDTGTGLPYQILLPPNLSSVTSLELPAQTVIDLTSSGLGAGGTEFAPANTSDTSPIIIMFSPGGRVDHLYVQKSVSPPLGSVHLLIGRSDQLDNILAATPATPNLENLSNLWVSISHRNGTVTSSEIADTVGMPLTTVAELEAKVSQARKFARTAQTMGG